MDDSSRYNYVDAIIDSAEAELNKTGQNAYHLVLRKEESISALIFWASHCYEIEISKDVFGMVGTYHWALYRLPGVGQELIAFLNLSEIFDESYLFGYVKGEPFDQRFLFSLPFEDYEEQWKEAGAIGAKFGQLIREDLEGMPSTLEKSSTRSNQVQYVIFNAYNSQDLVVRHHGEKFFNELIALCLKSLPDLQFLGIRKAEGKLSHFLLFEFSFRNIKYVLWCSRTLDDDEEGLSSDDALTAPGWNTWNFYHLGPDFDQRDAVSPGYYKDLSNMKGAALKANLVQLVTQSIRLHQGLESDEASGIDLQVVGNKGAKIGRPSVAPMKKWLDSEIKLADTFPAPIGKPQYGQLLDSRVPAELLALYSINQTDMKAAKRDSVKLLEMEWITWENKSRLVAKHSSQLRSLAEARFDSRFPEHAALVDKFSTRSSDVGSNISAYSWFISLGTVIFALVSSNLLFVIPGVMAILVSSGYRRTKYKPGYRARSLDAARVELVESFFKMYKEQFAMQVEEFATLAFGNNQEDWVKSTQGKWIPLGPRPVHPQRELTPQEAELFVSDHLIYLGARSVKLTRYSRDGGIDVESETVVVQVKHQKNPVGVKVVREILGVAASLSKRAAVFSKAGFTKEAEIFGQESGVLLFQYLPELKGFTALSRKVLELGFDSLD